MIQGSISEHLGDRTVVLAATGSVAAVQTLKLARELRRHGALVKPVATPSALKVVGKQALEWACDEPLVTELTGKAEHLDLADDGDLLLVAPATANTVAKMANGIADNALTSLAAAFSPEETAVAPAMHLELYESDAYRDNVETLRSRGVTVVPPRISEDAAKLAAPEEIVARSKRLLRTQDLPIEIVITGGTTAEPVDDVRILTTRASGKTGVALAREAYERGADVTLLMGRGTEEPPRWINTIRVETAAEMTENALAVAGHADALISSAAISDHSGEPHEGKLPSDEPLEIEMEPIPKMLNGAMEANPELTVVAYKAESRMDDEELIEAAGEKLEAGADLVVVNDVTREGAGFGTDTNEVIIVDGGSERVRDTKRAIAGRVLDRLA